MRNTHNVVWYVELQLEASTLLLLSSFLSLFFPPPLSHLRMDGAWMEEHMCHEQFPCHWVHNYSIPMTCNNQQHCLQGWQLLPHCYFIYSAASRHFMWLWEDRLARDVLQTPLLYSRVYVQGGLQQQVCSHPQLTPTTRSCVYLSLRICGRQIIFCLKHSCTCLRMAIFDFHLKKMDGSDQP